MLQQMGGSGAGSGGRARLVVSGATVGEAGVLPVDLEPHHGPVGRAVAPAARQAVHQCQATPSRVPQRRAEKGRPAAGHPLIKDRYPDRLREDLKFYAEGPPGGMPDRVGNEFVG